MCDKAHLYLEYERGSLLHSRHVYEWDMNVNETCIWMSLCDKTYMDVRQGSFIFGIWLRLSPALQICIWMRNAYEWDMYMNATCIWMRHVYERAFATRLICLCDKASSYLVYERSSLTHSYEWDMYMNEPLRQDPFVCETGLIHIHVSAIGVRARASCGIIYPTPPLSTHFQARHRLDYGTHTWTNDSCHQEKNTPWIFRVARIPSHADFRHTSINGLFMSTIPRKNMILHFPVATIQNIIQMRRFSQVLRWLPQYCRCANPNDSPQRDGWYFHRICLYV